jgi:hypothetical protein
MKPSEKQHDEPEASDRQAAVGTEHAGEDKKRRRLLIIVVLLLLLLLALILGWLWWKDKDTPPAPATKDKKASSATTTPATEEEVACADGFTAYQNTSLGFGFCYPESWGTVSANDAKFAAADAGSRWRLGFSSKTMVNLGVASTDWATTVPRDGVCVDPAVQTLSAFLPMSTSWVTVDTPVTEASRSIEGTVDYLIVERVDSVLTNGVCLEGYKIINGTYPHVAASYSAEFGGAVTDPDQHIANPNTLIPAADRDDFAVVVKSIHKL